MNDIWALFQSGGFVMYPLVLLSLLSWVVAIERAVTFFKMRKGIDKFHIEALQALLQKDHKKLKEICERSQGLPTAQVLAAGLDRMDSKDEKLQRTWKESMERRRQTVNLEMRGGLWVLGTVASASPFVGLFGTVVGILKTFEQLSITGAGGFAVVAGGIAEALIATAAGIIVAVVALIAYNAFQTYLTRLAHALKIQTEEFEELLTHGH